VEEVLGELEAEMRRIDSLVPGSEEFESASEECAYDLVRGALQISREGSGRSRSAAGLTRMFLMMLETSWPYPAAVCEAFARELLDGI
jgi:hypothetical protein